MDYGFSPDLLQKPCQNFAYAKKASKTAKNWLFTVGVLQFLKIFRYKKLFIIFRLQIMSFQKMEKRLKM